MSKQDRQKLSILGVLVGVLALTVVLGYRMNQPQTTAAVQPSVQKNSANPPAANDARIRLDLVESGGNDGNIGKRNLFQYQQDPPPPVSAGRGAARGSALNTPPAPATIPLQTRPPGPPQPPPIGLKYQGYAATLAPNRGFTAFLSDDSRHYNVTVGEVLMGRFRIASITDTSVEVEDLQNNRRQILPLLN
jgi:hypothetical protein